MSPGFRGQWLPGCCAGELTSRGVAAGGEAAGLLGSSLSSPWQREQQDGRRNVVLFAQAAADSPVGRKGLKARRLFLLLGARFSVLTMFASRWMKDGMLVPPEPTSYSVTHPTFPTLLQSQIP